MTVSFRLLVLFAPLFVGACTGSDPILERAAELDQGGGSNGGGGSPSPGGPAKAGEPVPPSPAKGGGPQPGVPSEPQPGVPDQPPPGGEAGGNGAQGMAIQGPAVTLKGTISVSEWKSGEIRIDVFDGDQQDLTGPRPSVVGFGRLEKPGMFTVQVPESAGRVWLGAFHDEDSDGRPGPLDPSGWFPGNPVVLDSQITGLDFELERRPPPGGKME